MGRRRTIEDTMADAYDSSVARQQREEDEKNERAARLGGDTIEETMSNVYDDIQDRERKSEAEQSYEYGQSATPKPEPEPKKWYDYDQPDDPYEEAEDVYDPPKPNPVVQAYPETPAPVVKPTPAPSLEPEPEDDIYGPYADSKAFFSELMAASPNQNPYAGPPAAPLPGRQPRNPYDPYGDYQPPVPQIPVMRIPQPLRPPVVGQPMDWNGGNPWGNPYQVRPVAPRQPHPAQQPPPPAVGQPADWIGGYPWGNPYQVRPMATRQPHPAQQPPPVTPVTVTPVQPGLKGETGTDSGEYDMTQASRMTKAFLDKIASLESEGKGGYHAINKNALGRYQLTRLARYDAGPP